MSAPQSGEGKRTYRMTARAEAAQATGEAILAAAGEAFRSLSFEQVTLNKVADGAGVTVQTVIRRFGSKEQLFEAVGERERARILATREVDDSADLPTAVRVLIDHYEQDGDTILHLVAQERHSELVSEVVADGRTVHRQWVERHCRSLLVGRRGKERSRRLYAAIAATDLGTWKLLARDLGLERKEVEAIMIKMLHGIGEGS